MAPNAKRLLKAAAVVVAVAEVVVVVVVTAAATVAAAILEAKSKVGCDVLAKKLDVVDTAFGVVMLKLLATLVLLFL